MKKKILFIILIVLIIFMLLLVVLKINSNNNSNQLSDINVSNITFKDISYYYNDNRTTFKLNAVSNNNEKLKLNNYNILIYDDNDNLIDIYNFNNSYVFEKGNMYYMEFVIDMEYKDSYKLKIELPELEVIK